MGRSTQTHEPFGTLGSPCPGPLAPFMEQPVRTSIEQDYFDMRRTTAPENREWLEEWISAMEAYRVKWESTH